MRISASLLVLIFHFLLTAASAQSSFVTTRGHQFYLNNKPYYYIGTNYWYGSYLPLEKNKTKGVERLRKELDFLKLNGVTNLRVLAGVEGSGQINGVQRVTPAVQPKRGVFDEKQLYGLDVLLSEMAKRNMKAVIFLSNNWEWSGGFLQYLNWNGLIADSVMQRKLNWDELRDYTSKFYSCDDCKKDYLKQVKFIVNRTNKVTKKKYTSDPAIMAWELVNEPRPMRPSANEAYHQWISSTAAYIKSLDKNHLVTLGHEGEMATDNNIDLYEQVHADKNVDYLTIHIWPKNWGWFKPETLEQDYPKVRTNTLAYIDKHVVVATKLDKPLVIEEFGLPRDNHSFDLNASTTLRDDYYKTIFNEWQKDKQGSDVINGINFWAFGGMGRPVQGQVTWKDGDDYVGDPLMEEQGLNSVFDSDKSTWDVITSYTKATATSTSTYGSLSDKSATLQTQNLYRNLKKTLNEGIMFGHQDDLAYGVGWKYVPGKSDVKELVGDYPAVYGWELGNLELDMKQNLDTVPFDKMKEFIKQAYQRGGVNTISWHFTNPASMKNAWDVTPGGVGAILPGGAKHELYKSWLDKLAAFMLSLKGNNGEAIPVLFRPFHELTGSWFWWGKNECTPTEFKLLWRFTVNYLQHVKKVHNLIYVFNTGSEFNSKEEFLERYPGDDVVDMVSFDAYQYGDPSKDNSFVKDVDKRLGIIDAVANEKGKIAALAEAGYERIPYGEWWTNTLWKAISGHRISYVLVWRNAGLQPSGNWHYYVPKKGDVSEQDFMKFYGLDKTLFQKEAAKEKLYQ
jgi:mannan endo-1,4-beta-mannosidase